MEPGELPDGFTKASVVAAHGARPWGNTFDRLKANENAVIAALRKPAARRSAEEQSRIVAAFAKANSDMDKLVKSIDGEIGVLRESLKTGKTTVMVMDEAAANRKTPMLVRGQYDQHGEIVTPGIPAIFGSLPADGTNRLALADWLTDPAHPLTPAWWSIATGRCSSARAWSRPPKILVRKVNGRRILSCSIGWLPNSYPPAGTCAGS